MDIGFEILVKEIADATRASLLSLFENNEKFYYVSLITTGEGHSPFMSAWSWEALERESAKAGSEDKYNQTIKWSYADSPYCLWGTDKFNRVNELFNKRPFIHNLNSDEWDKELAWRLSAMEQAMKKLDSENIFEKNQPRTDICILVEVMPPDHINTEIALRLNYSGSKRMKEWLEEAAE